MSEKLKSKIIGTGIFLPGRVVANEAFLDHEFYDSKGEKIVRKNQDIIHKFQEITTIEDRRYVDNDMVASDIAHLAAVEAIKDAGIDQEILDYIIVAHNFGDIKYGTNRIDIVPTLAARVKAKLGIVNPFTVAYDLPFGCPGWVQAMIQADYYLKSGDAKNVLIIGAETLSRIIDPHDRDSMIYADGAGATVLTATKEADKGIIAHISRSDTYAYSKMLTMDKSYKLNGSPENLYIKMQGRRLYQYALENVPQSIKACLEKANVSIDEVDKVLIHQANGKMDDAIIHRLYKLYDKEVPDNVMPMIISWIGNSSVATVPTLLDLILKGQVDGHNINAGDTIVFASVGAGMNINAVVYKF